VLLLLIAVYCLSFVIREGSTGLVHGYSKGPRWMSGDLQCRPKARLWRVPGLGLILMLPGCAFNLSPFSSSPPPASPVTAIPPSLRPDDIVGRWGLAAYHRDQDRARTEVAAKDQCTQPYLIDRSPDGNIFMLGHDNPQPQEMILKGSVEGKTYVGPGPSPAAADDREVVSFEGQVMGRSRDRGPLWHHGSGALRSRGSATGTCCSRKEGAAAKLTLHRF
jgi:hypothetical protein